MKSFKCCVLVLVLLSVLFYANCQAIVSSTETFGANITLVADTTYILTLTASGLTTASAYLNVTSTSNCTIQVSQVSNVYASFPDSVQNIQGTAAIGFNIQKFCSNGTLTMSYTYSMDATIQAALSAITGVVADAVQFDASANAYMSLNAQTQGSGNVTFYPQDWVPAGGNITFYIVAFSTNKFRQALYNRYALFRAGVNQTYQYSQGLVLSLLAQEDVYVNATAATTVNSHPSAPAPSDSSSSGVHFQGVAYMSFHAQPVQNSGQATFNATIQYAYNATAVAMEQIKAATLVFYKFVNGVWQAQANGHVDVQANVVVQSTSSFSDWAVYGQSTMSSSSSAASTMSSSGAFRINTSLVGISTLVALLIAFLF